MYGRYLRFIFSDLLLGFCSKALFLPCRVVAEFCVAAAGSARSPDDLLSVLCAQGTLKNTPYDDHFLFQAWHTSGLRDSSCPSCGQSFLVKLQPRYFFLYFLSPRSFLTYSESRAGCRKSHGRNYKEKSGFYSFVVQIVNACRVTLCWMTTVLQWLKHLKKHCQER